MKLVSSLFIVLIVGAMLSFSGADNPTKNVAAPEISFKNTDGVETKLSSLKGNIVLIDFWASWCRPCRLKHPELVGVYNEFKDAKFKDSEGFEIFSVSLDKDKEAWKKAIEADKLEWSNHVSDLKGWQSQVVATYGIKSIPYNVLLNEKGEIIAANLHGEQLKKILKDLQ